MSYHDDFISFMGGMDGIEKIPSHRAHPLIPTKVNAPQNNYSRSGLLLEDNPYQQQQQQFYMGYNNNHSQQQQQYPYTASYHQANTKRVVLGPQDMGKFEYSFASSAPSLQDEMEAMMERNVVSTSQDDDDDDDDDNENAEDIIDDGGATTTSAMEHPMGEHPSRTLFVRNISSNVDDEQLRDLFEVHCFVVILIYFLLGIWCHS